MKLAYALLLLSSLVLPLTAEAGELVVSADFEGGSARVEEIDQAGRIVRISPDERPERGWVCWWFCRIDGIEPGEILTLDVGGGVWATPDRATFSLDGETWQHTEPGKRGGKRIVYRQRIDAKSAWFAWGPPFTPQDAAALCQRIAKESPHATAFELCRTRGGRATPALRIRQDGVEDEERYGIWIQARQHAWESGSSWVGRGFVEWLVSDDEAAERLRKTSLVTFVPIMDIDNTAIGAGGKAQVPQDHNRDWTDEPYWRSVEAAQHGIAQLDAAGRFDLFVDLHNPGAGDRRPYYYVPPDDLLSDRGRRNLRRFVAVSKQEIVGPPKLADATRVSGSNYDKQWRAISKNWVAEHTRDHVVAVTLETSWNTPHGTPEGYQRIGRQLGRAIAGTLAESPRAPDANE
jgi:hypothetical protein